MRVLGYWLGLWDIVYISGSHGKSWLRVVHKNVFGEKYVIIGLMRNKLMDGGRADGCDAERWMHYNVRKRLADIVIEGLSTSYEGTGGGFQEP